MSKSTSKLIGFTKEQHLLKNREICFDSFFYNVNVCDYGMTFDNFFAHVDLSSRIIIIYRMRDRFLRTINSRKNDRATPGHKGACRIGSEDASLQRHVRGKVGSNGVPTILRGRGRGRGLRPR